MIVPHLAPSSTSSTNCHPNDKGRWMWAKRMTSSAPLIIPQLQFRGAPRARTLVTPLDPQDTARCHSISSPTSDHRREGFVRPSKTLPPSEARSDKRTAKQTRAKKCPLGLPCPLFRVPRSIPLSAVARLSPCCPTHQTRQSSNRVASSHLHQTSPANFEARTPSPTPWRPFPLRPSTPLTGPTWAFASAKVRPPPSPLPKVPR